MEKSLQVSAEKRLLVQGNELYAAQKRGVQEVSRSHEETSGSLEDRLIQRPDYGNGFGAM